MSRRPEDVDDDDDDQGGGSAEELAIVKEEVVELVYRIMEAHLKDQPWNEASVPEWISRISSEVIKGLTDQQRPYKFTVTTMIMQNNGAGVHSATSQFWDTSVDGVFPVSFPRSRDNKTPIYAICTVGAFQY